jgi:hypothetical protein
VDRSDGAIRLIIALALIGFLVTALLWPHYQHYSSPALINEIDDSQESKVANADMSFIILRHIPLQTQETAALKILEQQKFKLWNGGNQQGFDRSYVATYDMPSSLTTKRELRVMLYINKGLVQKVWAKIFLTGP